MFDKRMSMPGQRETLLIVDDEDTIRKLLCLKLSREGYLCKEADSAEYALNVLETNSDCSGYSGYKDAR